LLELRIGQLGLVDELVLTTDSGLTMLTGETGAGKSMIAGALSLLCGGRVPKDFVRDGENVGWVEAVFDLAASPQRADSVRRAGIRLGDDGILVLRRELRREGRSRVMINGLVSSLAVLERIGPTLLSIQSQHQQLELGRPGFARDYLDDALGLADLRIAMELAWTAWGESRSELERFASEIAAAREQADLWRYQHDELSAAGLDPEEEESLAERLAVLQDTARLRQGAAKAMGIVGDDGAAAEMLGRASAALPDTGTPIRVLDEARSALLEAQESASAASSLLERFLDGIDLDGGDLDELQARKALYEELRRKYRREVVDLIEYRDDLGERLERHDSAEAGMTERREALDRARNDVEAAAAGLRDARRTGAGPLSRRALKVIRPLALDDLELEFAVAAAEDDQGGFAVDGRPCRVDAKGADIVSLQVRTNKGEARRPVDDVASGGERSRIYLGLTALVRGDVEPPLLLLDEIDAGLGLDAARPVARLLGDLARHGQVLCITHLPTMAVHGQRHWRAVKNTVDGRTLLDVQAVENEDRLRELERLLGGGDRPDDDRSQRDFAEKLLREAKAGTSSRN